MSVIERDVVNQSVDQDGNQTIDFPLARLGWIEDAAEVKAEPAAEDYIPVVDTADGGQMKKFPAKKLTDAADKAARALSLIQQAAFSINTVPSQVGSLVYNGSEQTPRWSGYNPDQLTIGGTVKGTAAGVYSVTFTPLGDYVWADGTQDPVTVNWTIAKAAGSLSLSAATLALSPSAGNGSVTVTRAGDGVISAISSDTSVAAVSVSGTTVTISNVNQKDGSATITVKVAEGSNHLAPADKTVAVTAKFMPDKKALNDTSWAEIRIVSAADQGANYWAVGDRKAVPINGTVGQQAINGTYYVYILGFNHNVAREGKGIHFGGFKTALIDGTDICLIDNYFNQYQSYNGTKYFQMNHWGNSSNSNTNYGGWAACDMRYDILGSTDKAPTPYGSVKTITATGQNPSTACATKPVANTLMAALPADLRAVMQPMTKYTDNKGNTPDVAASVTATTDYLPLLSEIEIFGTNGGGKHYANKYERNYQEQYAYFSSGNSQVKNSQRDTGSRAYYWLRGPAYYDSSDNNLFCYTDGKYLSPLDACKSLGLAPVFKV